VSNDHHTLNEQVRDLVQKKDNEKRDRELARSEKERAERLKRKWGITSLHETKGNNFLNWNARECRMFLQYKKVDGDPAMPSKVEDLRNRCSAIAHRASPTSSPHASDDEGEI